MDFKELMYNAYLDYSSDCTIKQYDCNGCEFGEAGHINSKVCAIAYGYKKAVETVRNMMCEHCQCDGKECRTWCKEYIYLERLVK